MKVTQKNVYSVLKKISLFTLAIMLVSLATGLFSGCEKKETHVDPLLKDHIVNCYSAMITDLQYPDVIQAGKPVVFDVTFMKPTPCDSLQGFQMKSSGNDYILDVCLLLSSEPCITVIEIAQAKFTLSFPAPGDYTLRYNSEEGEKVVNIKVSP